MNTLTIRIQIREMNRFRDAFAVRSKAGVIACHTGQFLTTIVSALCQNVISEKPQEELLNR